MLTLAVDLPPMTHRAAANATLPWFCTTIASVSNTKPVNFPPVKAENV